MQNESYGNEFGYYPIYIINNTRNPALASQWVTVAA